MTSMTRICRFRNFITRTKIANRRNLTRMTLSIISAFQVLQRIISRARRRIRYVIYLIILNASVTTRVTYFSNCTLHTSRYMNYMNRKTFFTSFIRGSTNRIGTRMLIRYTARRIILFIDLLRQSMRISLNLFYVIIERRMSNIFNRQRRILYLQKIKQTFINRRQRILTRGIMCLIRKRYSNGRRLYLMIKNAISITHRF